MKTKIFLIAFALIFCSGILFADKGDGGKLNGARSIKVSPITLSIKQGIYIEASFLTTLGNIEVSIKNKRGVEVYNNSVDSDYNPNLYINISHLSQDSYTISFTDENGVKILINDFSIH